MGGEGKEKNGEGQREQGEDRKRTGGRQEENREKEDIGQRGTKEGIDREGTAEFHASFEGEGFSEQVVVAETLPGCVANGIVVDAFYDE